MTILTIGQIGANSSRELIKHLLLVPFSLFAKKKYAERKDVESLAPVPKTMRIAHEPDKSWIDVYNTGLRYTFLAINTTAIIRVQNMIHSNLYI